MDTDGLGRCALQGLEALAVISRAETLDARFQKENVQAGKLTRRKLTAELVL